MGLLDSMIRAAGDHGVSTLITYALIIIVFTMLVNWIIKRQKLISMLDKIPGPKAIPILGNALEFNVGPIEVFKAMNGFCDYGTGCSRIWMGLLPFCFLYKANSVEVILSCNKNIDKSSEYSFFHPWLGTGLLTSTGSKWHSRRKALNPAFHFNILEGFVDVFNQQANKLVTKLMPHAGDKVINMIPFVACAALDIICETAMGVSPNAQDTGDSEYVKAIHKINHMLFKRAWSPWLQPNIIWYLLGYEAEHDKCLKVLHGFTNNAIAERKQLLNEKKMSEKKEKEDDDIGKKKRLAFLDLLLDISDNGANFSDSDIREEVDTITFAGHDTSSASINWSLYLIGSYPDVQDRVQEELYQVFGDSDRPATMADLRELKYLECCIKEALRLFPAAPLILRQLKEELIIDGYQIPSGTRAMIFIYRLHRDPEQFPEPEKFEPERFTPENSAKRHNFAYLPFSAGPRNCIGQKFSMMEQKILISSVLRKFEVTSTVRREDLKILAEVILRPEDGIFLKLKPRVLPEQRED